MKNPLIYMVGILWNVNCFLWLKLCNLTDSESFSLDMPLKKFFRSSHGRSIGKTGRPPCVKHLGGEDVIRVETLAKLRESPNGQQTLAHLTVDGRNPANQLIW